MILVQLTALKSLDAVTQACWFHQFLVNRSRKKILISAIVFTDSNMCSELSKPLSSPELTSMVRGAESATETVMFGESESD